MPVHVLKTRILKRKIRDWNHRFRSVCKNNSCVWGKPQWKIGSQAL